MFSRQVKRIIMHLDMNSYFASVEQQANPFFRNKPLGVCAYLSANGCIIASSAEAKKLGITTGCRVKEARFLCPGIILVENDPDKYRTLTAKLFTLLKEYSSDFEPYSIDEAFLDLTGLVENYSAAANLAQKISDRIKNELGEWLKCSIGISYTKFLAKFCSDTAAKGQVKIFTPQDSLTALYSQTKLTDAWGINTRLAERLNHLGIFNLLDLKNFPVQNLMPALGKTGYFLWAKVNGLEFESVGSSGDGLTKSIGHSYCLSHPSSDKKYLAKVLFKLAEKTGRRLRAQQRQALGVYIYWSYKSGSGFGRRLKLKTPMSATEEIFKKTFKILQAATFTEAVRMLAVGVFYLTSTFNQLNLFAPAVSDQLTQTIDEINKRYGHYAVYRGLLWQTQKLAKDRIGFRKIDDLPG